MFHFLFVSSFFVVIVTYNLRSLICSLSSVCTPIRWIQSESKLSVLKNERGSTSTKFEVTTIQDIYSRKEVKLNIFIQSSTVFVLQLTYYESLH